VATVATHRLRTWRLAAALAGAITAAALAAPRAEPGLLLPPEPVDACDRPSSQVFRPWGDLSYYRLMPGGSFESGSYPWWLTGGAKVVAGNEPFYVNGSRDRRSLFLPSGSSATSPPACFGVGDWHLRFFAVNAGARASSLRVSVVVMHVLGTPSVVDGGTVSHTGSWQPSPKIGLLVSNLTSPLGGRSISLRFTPTGSNAAWRIDDVYLDPWKGT
jgi:hypothetical protein